MFIDSIKSIIECQNAINYIKTKFSSWFCGDFMWVIPPV